MSDRTKADDLDKHEDVVAARDAAQSRVDAVKKNVRLRTAIGSLPESDLEELHELLSNWMQARMALNFKLAAIIDEVEGD